MIFCPKPKAEGLRAKENNWTAGDGSSKTRMRPSYLLPYSPTPLIPYYRRRQAHKSLNYCAAGATEVSVVGR